MVSTAPSEDSHITIQPTDSISVVSSASDSDTTPPNTSSTISTSQTSKKWKRQRNLCWKYARKALKGVETAVERVDGKTRTIWYCSLEGANGCNSYYCRSTAAANNHLLKVYSIDTSSKTTSIVQQKKQQDLMKLVTKEQQRKRDKDEQTVKEGLKAAANLAAIKQALLRLIVHHDLLLSFVEWPEVHTLVNAINYLVGDCIWTSYQTTANKVAKTFTVRRQQLLQQLQQSRSLIHLTTDT